VSFVRGASVSVRLRDTRGIPANPRVRLVSDRSPSLDPRRPPWFGWAIPASPWVRLRFEDEPRRGEPGLFAVRLAARSGRAWVGVRGRGGESSPPPGRGAAGAAWAAPAAERPGRRVGACRTSPRQRARCGMPPRGARFDVRPRVAPCVPRVRVRPEWSERGNEAERGGAAWAAPTRGAAFGV
jgi:hypothetical protein